MKRKLLALLACVPLFVTSCGEDTKLLNQLKEENEELKKRVEELEKNINVKDNSSTTSGINEEAGNKEPVGNKYEIAVVTDGYTPLMDGAFNQGTWEGAKEYAEEHGKTVNYYQPTSNFELSDSDRYNAMKQAIDDGAKIIITSPSD